MTSSRIVGWMLAAIALLGAIAYLAERSRDEAAFADFAADQVMLARAAAGELRGSMEAHPGISDVATILATEGKRLRALEQPGDVVVLVRAPGSRPTLVTVDGKEVSSPPLEARFAAPAADATWVRLDHEEAQLLGLPARTAVAGLAEIDQGGGQRWGIAVVTSAHRERDREERGERFVGLGFMITAAIVLTFGGLAMRLQRKEFELAQRLAVSEAEHARDERLVQADKLATLGALATGIAHQVATPLGVIVGRAERLSARVSTDEKARRSVDVISEQAQRIHGIVRGFLGLARGGVPSLEHVGPGDIARAAIELVAHRFEKARVDVRCELPDRLPTIACDPRLFEQVIVNLLLNACDACQPGGKVTLTVSSAAAAVAFVVEDDGEGMTKEAAARATEPFFTTKAEEGTGLGLAIANEIVKHHRGTLNIGPRAPRGTRARVEVPAVTDGEESWES
jgi:two-component system, NtrC family, sensor kinase